MGYSVETMCLFIELAERGHFKDIKRAVDFGSQELHFGSLDVTSSSYKESIRRAIAALGGPHIDEAQLERLANRGPASEFFSLVGIAYKALDADGWYGPPFDFNLDQVVAEDRGKYCITLNCGTTEHLIDQRNAFSVAHDLTRVGGLMLHAVPFLGKVDHGYFNYNPNFFTDLARFNSYEVLGLWLNIAKSAALIPWVPGDHILDHFKFTADGRHSVALVCVLRKTCDLEFCIPFQSSYESAQTPENLARYSYVVDGARLSGRLAFEISQKHSSLEKISGRNLLGELVRRMRRRLTLSSKK